MVDDALETALSTAWAPLAVAAVLVVGTLVWSRTRRTRLRKSQQEMSRLRAFAAMHETRADDLSVKVDQQRSEAEQLAARLETVQGRLDSAREELATRRKEPDRERLLERIAELENENARLVDGAETDQLRAWLGEVEARHAEEAERHRATIRELETALSEHGAGRGGSPDAAELIRLRTRVVDLERAKADLEMRRDQLMARLSGVADIDVLRERITALEDENAELRRELADAPSRRLMDLRAGAEAFDGGPPDSVRVDVTELPDLEEAARVLGGRVAPDDLQAIDGIGPKIARLCHEIGIDSWEDLAAADPATLRTMLARAGPRYRTHDPTSWTRQAALLASGRWEEFRLLVDENKSARRR